MATKKAAAAAALASAGALLAANTVRAVKFKPEKKEYPPLVKEKVNTERFIKNLSDAIKFKTISNNDPEKVDWNEFNRFHEFLKERYPHIFSELKIEIVSRASLLIRWEGKNPNLDPIALLGHQDVVPVTDGTLDDWEHPPFDGEVADGFIWGRGALDMKNHVIGVLEAVETLLEEGFEPERDVYVLLGHNEETVATKESGADAMAALLKERGVHLDCIIDEGGAILPVNIPHLMNLNLAGVGVGEKGYADFKITLNTKGGHSAQPPKHTAVGKMADVIKDIESHQFKAHLNPFMIDLFTRIGQNMSFPGRFVACNINYMKPLITKVMTYIPPAASMVRTTTGVTQMFGSPQANVLPQKASIVVNFRIMPGQSIADVEKHLHKVIRNKNVEIELLGGKEPSHLSPTDSRAFHAIEDICRRMNNDNLVAPYLVMGGTDAYRYEGICENVYRYSPFMVNTSLLLTTHGTNERIPVDCMEDGVAFFKMYIRTLSGE